MMRDVYMYSAGKVYIHYSSNYPQCYFVPSRQSNKNGTPTTLLQASYIYYRKSKSIKEFEHPSQVKKIIVKLIKFQ